MKNSTKTLLSAVVLTAIIVPTATFASYWEMKEWKWERWENRYSQMQDSWERNFHKWDFKDLTLEERIEKINSNEKLSDELKTKIIKKITEANEKRSERKAEIESLFENASDEIKAIHEKRKAWEEISDDEKEVIKAFFKENWIEAPHKKWKKWHGKKGKRWEFKNLTLEEKIEKINSNEKLSDEQKTERVEKVTVMEEKRSERKAEIESLFENASDEIKAIHEKRKAWEEISDDEKEVIKAFFKENWIEAPHKKWKKWGDEWKNERRSDRVKMFENSKDSVEKIESMTSEEKQGLIEKLQEMINRIMKSNS